jgi:hypothetical protein
LGEGFFSCKTLVFKVIPAFLPSLFPDLGLSGGPPPKGYFCNSMITAAELESAVLSLGPQDRGQLAVLLLDSLSDEAWDEDELLAEAERREMELDKGLLRELSHEEFVAVLRRP